MKIAVTGATGFIGRYLLRELLGDGHDISAWYRSDPSREGIEPDNRLTWQQGGLQQPDSDARLLDGCEAVVHAALWRPGRTFRGGEGKLTEFAEINVMGSLRLIESARRLGVKRFVYVSTCAVHEKILDDRPLDECHPMWPLSHYGAHKAAVEAFVYSYGLGEGYPICAIRPSGVYGVTHDVTESKYFSLVKAVVRGESVTCRRGGKEVHALDVARGVSCLLQAPETEIAGQAFNCCDRYISEYDVAHLAKVLSGSSAAIAGEPKSPKHQIQTGKIRELGLKFGGDALLTDTIQRLIEAC